MTSSEDIGKAIARMLEKGQTQPRDGCSACGHGRKPREIGNVPQISTARVCSTKNDIAEPLDGPAKACGHRAADRKSDSEDYLTVVLTTVIVCARSRRDAPSAADYEMPRTNNMSA